MKFIILKWTVQWPVVIQCCTTTPLVPNCLYHPKRKAHPYEAVTPHSFLPPQPWLPPVCSLSPDGPILHFSYRRSRTICGFLCLASLTDHHAFEVHPRGSLSQCFLFMAGYVHCVATPQCPPVHCGIWVVPIAWPLWVVLLWTFSYTYLSPGFISETVQAVRSRSYTGIWALWLPI